MSSPLDGAYYAPTPPSDHEILADTRRIADQILRSNPMENALVKKGLTRWQGNYGGEFAWFGEFLPLDPNLNKPQRGISFVRDDPGQKSAFAMYDPNPQAGRPLRQRIFMHDADGRRLLTEGDSGGLAYPYWPVMMFRADAGGYIETNQTTDRLIFTGRTANMGRHMEAQGFGTSFNNESGAVFMKVTAEGGATLFSETFTYTGVGGFNLAVDMGASGGLRDAPILGVEIYCRKTGGPGNIIIQLRSVYNFSKGVF